jgi:hypothetical protein
MTHTPCIHFVGFRTEAEVARAAAVFGGPDFVHRFMDARAVADVAPGDTVVLHAREDGTVRPYSWDDSNQPDDPAAAERKGMR